MTNNETVRNMDEEFSPKGQPRQKRTKGFTEENFRGAKQEREAEQRIAGKLTVNQETTRIENITQRIRRKAKRFGGDNENLKTILRMHFNYSASSNGKPYQYEGIEFFPVGQNASHAFYLGEKDGKVYRLSMGEDDYKVLNPGDPHYKSKEYLVETIGYKPEELTDGMLRHLNTEPVIGEHISEVHDLSTAYLGHF